LASSDGDNTDSVLLEENDRHMAEEVFQHMRLENMVCHFQTVLKNITSSYPDKLYALLVVYLSTHLPHPEGIVN
jgi:hypothetical protein